MSNLSFAFDINNHLHTGTSYNLIAEKTSYTGFCIPLQSVSTAFHRILYQLNRNALVSVITTDINSLLVTFFNLPSNKARQYCENAISILHSPITFSIKESKFTFDQYMIKTAYEALIARALEEIGWWLLNDSGSTMLFNQKGYAISDFKITSNPSLQFVSQIIKKSNDVDNKITINISGKKIYKHIPKFSIPDKLLEKIFNEKGAVDLDYIPCKVLPKFRKAFVTHIIKVKNDLNTNVTKKKDISDFSINENNIIFPSTAEIQEIQDYWKYSHGIFLNNISAIVKVSFAHEGDSLTYPIECVIDYNTFSNISLKKDKLDFDTQLKDYISTTIDVVSLNQESNSKS